MSNRPRCIILVGLPGSGKSTWAIDYCHRHQNTVRVNKDSLRLMAYGEPYRPEWEYFICDMRDTLIKCALEEGNDVIVDDTNLKEEHVNRITAIANFCNAEVKIKDFTDVPLEWCLDRNKRRPNPVPEDAIYHMQNHYLASGDIVSILGRFPEFEE